MSSLITRLCVQNHAKCQRTLKAAILRNGFRRSNSAAKPDQKFPQISQFHTSGNRCSVADGGKPTHMPSPFQQKILVWTKVYPSVEAVPERVTKGQMKKSMDMFRVRMSLGMVGLAVLFSAIMGYIGHKQRKEGRGITKDILAQREAGKRA